MGQKLAAGVGSGADTLTSGRWATEDREVDTRCNPLGPGLLGVYTLYEERTILGRINSFPNMYLLGHCRTAVTDCH